MAAEGARLEAATVGEVVSILADIASVAARRAADAVGLARGAHERLRISGGKIVASRATDGHAGSVRPIWRTNRAGDAVAGSGT